MRSTNRYNPVISAPEGRRELRRVPRVVLNACPVAIATAARVEDNPWHPPRRGEMGQEWRGSPPVGASPRTPRTPNVSGPGAAPPPPKNDFKNSVSRPGAEVGGAAARPPLS